MAASTALVVVILLGTPAYAGPRNIDVVVTQGNCPSNYSVAAVLGTVIPSSDIQTGWKAGNTFTVEGVPTGSNPRLVTVAVTARCKHNWKFWNQQYRAIEVRRYVNKSSTVFYI